mgnify:CR=1 FL=1
MLGSDKFLGFSPNLLRNSSLSKRSALSSGYSNTNKSFAYFLCELSTPLSKSILCAGGAGYNPVIPLIFSYPVLLIISLNSSNILPGIRFSPPEYTSDLKYSFAKVPLRG